MPGLIRRATPGLDRHVAGGGGGGGGDVISVDTWADLLAAEAGAAEGAEYQVQTGGMAGNWTKVITDVNGHNSEAFWPTEHVKQGLELVQDAATSTHPGRYDSVVGDVPADVVGPITTTVRGWENKSTINGLFSDAGAGIMQMDQPAGDVDWAQLAFEPDLVLTSNNRLVFFCELDVPIWSNLAGGFPYYGGCIRMFGNSGGRMFVSGVRVVANKYALTHDGQQAQSLETMTEALSASLPAYWRVYGIFEGWGTPGSGSTRTYIWTVSPTGEVWQSCSTWWQVRAQDFGGGGINRFEFFVFRDAVARLMRVRRFQVMKIG
jgi:hypothetical protein